MITRLHVSQHSFIVLYTDDVLIFALSLQGLQNIVNTCELDMAINAKKSSTMQPNTCLMACIAANSKSVTTTLGSG